MATSDGVLEAFRKNDTDGSGSISRDELAAVLKYLDPEEFDDASLDHLLAVADASGDGELQVEEFVAWLYAEDGKVTKPGPISYIIENCPTPGLDGEYVQQEGKFYGRRPVYYSGLARKYLFYHAEHQQWQVYKQTSTRAIARLKTTKAPSTLLKSWEVRQKTSTGSWTYCEASWMSCRVAGAPSSVEEMIERAPKHIFVEADDSKIRGGFSKGDMAWNNRPAWFNKMDKTFLCFDEGQKFWGVCTNPRDSDTFVAKSQCSEVWSPELVDWEEGLTVLAIDPKSKFFQKIEKKYAAADAPKEEKREKKEVKREENKEKKVEEKNEKNEKKEVVQTWTLDLFWNQGGEDEPGFIDPEFPHMLQGKWSRTPVEWVRAIYLGCDGYDEQPRLFDDIEPANVCQGSVGNCWLIAAIAAVAEFPSWIKDQLFVTKGLSEEGKYEIRLYDWVAKEWKVITIDDRIPCHARKELQPKPATLFAKVPGDEVYVPLLEKAFAKIAGCYGHLHGGDSINALMALTGETYCLKWQRTVRKNNWTISSKEGVLVRKERGSGEKLGRLARSAGVIEEERDGYFIRFRKLYGEGPQEGWFSCYHRGRPTAKIFVEAKDTDWSRGVVTVPEKLQFNKSCAKFNKASLTGEDGEEPEQCEQDSQGMWAKVREYDDANYIITAVPAVDCDRAASGIVTSHVYSILRAVEIDDFQLICCRNPWGSGEWKGPWSDNSEEWTANPQVAKALNVADKQDGIFWMDWNDFHARFQFIGVCMKSMPTKRADFDVNNF